MSDKEDLVFQDYVTPQERKRIKDDYGKWELKNNSFESKIISIRVFSSYSKSKRAWYVSKQKMTRKQFTNYIRDWKVQEFKKTDAWRCGKEQTYSWKEGYICKLHD